MSTRFVSAWACALPVTIVCVSCAQRSISLVEPDPVVEDKVVFDIVKNRDLDLLFVVDNSNSMTGEQTSLAREFPRMTAKFAQAKGGLPNLHLAVISTDLGTGPRIDGQRVACSETGDNGEFQASAPPMESCETPNGQFIKDVATEGGERVRNYNGNIDDVFSCIARLGITGCGFEQPLESMRRALNGSNGSHNSGFLRENARLAVVFVTDEDDCSTADTAMFDSSQDSLSTTLGPFNSFRCFEFGVECEPDAPRQLGERENCRPRVDSPYMHNVHEYVEFLRGLKAFDSQIFVAGIVAPVAPVEVQETTNSVTQAPERRVAPTCGIGDAAARPPVRLQAFLEAFPQHRVETLCGEDLASAVQSIADAIRDLVDSDCLVGNPLDTDPDTAGLQPECTATQVRRTSDGPIEDRVLPACDNAEAPQRSTELPCIHIAEAAEQCPDAPHLQAKAYFAEGEVVPPAAAIDLRCRSL